jgi:hypothetical protein
MRWKANTAIQRLNRIFTNIVEERIPVCIWLYFTTASFTKPGLEDCDRGIRKL